MAVDLQMALVERSITYDLWDLQMLYSAVNFTAKYSTAHGGCLVSFSCSAMKAGLFRMPDAWPIWSGWLALRNFSKYLAT
jgi:hypothetical protein